MALSFIDKDTSIPIAKINDLKKIIYLEPNNNQFREVPQRNLSSAEYFCPFCEKELSTKERLEYHIKHGCTQKGKEMLYFPTLQTKGEKIQKLPLQSREIIFATGPPGCGKSYWVNEYVKAYTKLYDGKVYLVTTHEQDETLKKDMKKYISIAVTDALLKDPFELQDFKNSLVIFDDIETSKYPKATKYILNLMDDIAKNGRHQNINMIYVNQECRAGNITKKILTMMTGLVIFPQTGETYQLTRLLHDYCGFSKIRINKVLSLPSRWVYYSRVHPQYIIYETGVFILGKELYLS
jgi:hypothetical protein